MSNLKQIVTEYLDIRSHAKTLMDEDYTKDWTNYGGYKQPETPFEYRIVASHGGEDCDSEYYNVIEVRLADSPNETLLARIDGWYQSYYGAEYNDWKFVEPKQKTITVYE